MSVDIATYVHDLAVAAKAASASLATASDEQRQEAVRAMAAALRNGVDSIVAANELDMSAARDAGTSAGLLDRLLLTPERVEGMAAGLEKLAELPDPVGRVLDHRVLASGVDLTRVSVPLGLVAMVYEARPIRAGEIGLVHRHELRGALHGLFRVRCFNQDDAHLFVRPDQLTDEIVGVVNLIDSVYQKFGFKYHVELSTRPEDSMGSDEDWARAEEGLRTALEKLGMDYEVNEGDGAFYGPKIDFHLEDSLGRTWQCGTVQLDFQMPLNFDLEYVDADGTKKRPIMLHRVCFGSIERFIGILIEHFAGKFPTWLAPVQVKALPVSEKSRDYAHEVCAKLEEAGIRVACDDRDEKIGYKIREARSIDRVPYMLILGEKEVEAGNISVRDRSNETVQMTVDEFVAKVLEEIKTRA